MCVHISIIRNFYKTYYMDLAHVSMEACKSKLFRRVWWAGDRSLKKPAPWGQSAGEFSLAQGGLSSLCSGLGLVG